LAPARRNACGTAHTQRRSRAVPALHTRIPHAPTSVRPLLWSRDDTNQPAPGEETDMIPHRSILMSLVVCFPITLAACGDSGTTATFADYRIVAAGGGALTADVGDAFRLSVVEALSDGTTKPLADDAQVTWSGPPVVTALPIGSTPDESVLPQPAAAATGMWINNPDHLTAAQVNGVLFVLDAGSNANPSIEVTATVAGGAAPGGAATATVSVMPFPTADGTRGQALWEWPHAPTWTTRASPST